MTTQQLQFFFSAANSLSFTKVAAEFYTSQSTVSRQISYLEEEFGFPLFHRNGKKLHLTPAGAIMLSELTKYDNSLKATISSVQQLHCGFEGKLRVGFLTGFDTDYYIFPPTMAFANQYPKVSISIDSGSFQTLRHRLNNDEFDVIFTYEFELASLHDVSSKAIYKAGSSLVVSAQHPLSEKATLRGSDLLGEKIIIPTTFDSENTINRACAVLSRNFNDLPDDFREKVTLYPVDTLETKLFLLQSGSGIGFAGNCMKYLRDPSYTLFPIDDDPLEVHAIWRDSNTNPAIPLYLQVLSNAPSIDVFSIRGNRIQDK